MALTNFFHPILVAVSGTQCSSQPSNISMIPLSVENCNLFLQENLNVAEASNSSLLPVIVENGTGILRENIELATALNSSLLQLNAEDCISYLHNVPWICNPYTGQLVYAILYGITR